MIRQTIPLTLVVVIATACASAPPAPPSGDRRPVNSPGAIEALSAVEPEATEYDVAKRERRARLFHRAVDADSLGELPGNRLVERTVRVPFGFNSTRFMPTPEQALLMRELFAIAERIEVRGRTDGIGSNEADEQIARARAEAAKRYLIDRGVPGRIISVGYIAGGDYVADNARLVGRRANRRVDIEFVLPEVEDRSGTNDPSRRRQVAES